MNGRPGPGAAGVAKREDSYGPKSGPNAGSRASSPGEQAAACDYQTTRELGRGASRSLRLPKNSLAGPEAILGHSFLPLLTRGGCLSRERRNGARLRIDGRARPEP